MKNKILAITIRTLSVGFVLFQLITAATGSLPPLVQRPIHVFFAVTLTFLLVGAKKYEREEGKRKSISIGDLILIIIMTVSVVFILVNYNALMFWPFSDSIWVNMLAASTILIAMESSRRRVGITFPLLTALAAIYAFWGHLIPGYWGHAPLSATTILDTLFLTDAGVWGLVTGVSATLVAMFIIFGSFLLFTGGGQTLIDASVLVAAKMWGGGAKVAVISSAFFGMLSGSGVANSAATGNFTIPLMKNAGYPPEYAAAVEATASSGGSITPPIMGSTAFIMAELTGRPYLAVMTAAIIPSFLFYLTLLFSVDCYARKKRLPPLPSETVKSVRSVFSWRRLVPIVLPVSALVGLLINGFSAYFSAFWACIAAVASFIICANSISQLKANLKKTIDGFEGAGKALASIAPLLVCASIVVTLIQLTGISVKLTDLIMSLGKTSVLLSLMLGAMVAMILGMGVPVNAAYILCAAVVAPGLSKMGLSVLAVHMFIMYFACLANITPPICPAVFVTAGIAGSNWWNTGWLSARLGFIKYIIPFIFAFDVTLIMQGPGSAILLSLAQVTYASILMVIGIEGFFLIKVNALFRILFLISGMLVLLPQMQLTQIGFVLSIPLSLFMFWQWKKNRPTTKIKATV